LSNGTVSTRTLNGAVAGALAAVVWAFQQPLDKLVFSSRYDDVEVLGRAVRPGPGWYRAGLLLHAQNGALFGAVYANLAPALPIAPVLRGPAAALAELVATWPLAGVSDRFHPARTELPTLSGNRLNGVDATPPGAPPDYASNGHGSLDRAVSAVRD
jgi:hypothetical protein